MKTSILNLILLVSIFISCNNQDDFFNPNAERIPPVINVPTNFADPNLNEQAKELYQRLINTTQKGIAFGQQQPFGTGNNFPVTNQLENDFFEVAGDYPAIAGLI